MSFLMLQYIQDTQEWIEKHYLYITTVNSHTDHRICHCTLGKIHTIAGNNWPTHLTCIQCKPLLIHINHVFGFRTPFCCFTDVFQYHIPPLEPNMIDYALWTRSALSLMKPRSTEVLLNNYNFLACLKYMHQTESLPEYTAIAKGWY